MGKGHDRFLFDHMLKYQQLSDLAHHARGRSIQQPLLEHALSMILDTVIIIKHPTEHKRQEEEAF